MFQQALNIYTDIQDKYSLARLLATSIAPTQQKLNQPQAALQSWQQAQHLFAEIDFAYGVELCQAQIDQLQQPPPRSGISWGQILLAVGVLVFIGFNLLAGHWWLALALALAVLVGWLWLTLKGRRKAKGEG